LNGANYGELVAIAGAGLFIGSMLCLTFSPKLSFRYLIGLSSVFGAGAFLLFASSSDLTTAALGLFMLGLFQAFNATGFVTYLQRAIPLEIMGRVISTLGTAVQAATIVGVILGGWLSQDAGPRALMLTVGVVFFGVGIAISLFGWREPSFSQPLSANAKS
jgi:MFS family permease